jgi:iron complex outermembrane receptor protein
LGERWEQTTPYAFVDLKTGRLIAPGKRIGAPNAGVGTKKSRVYFDLTHELGDQLTLKMKGAYAKTLTSTIRQTFGAGPQPGSAYVLPTLVDIDNTTASFDGTLGKTLETGPLTSNILGGVTYQQERPVLDLAMHGPAFRPLDDLSLPAWGNAAVIKRIPNDTDSFSAFLQDQINWGRLHLLASITYNTAWNDKRSLHAWTPNAGISYDLTDYATVYASWMNSYEASGNLNLYTENGEPLPPKEGSTLETGVKLNFLDDRLGATASVFKSIYSNDAVSANNPDPFVYEVAQEKSRHGFEFDIDGEISTGWNISANYTYTDYEAPTEGVYVTPSRHRGSLWTTYDFQNDALRGWGIGAGVTAQTNRLYVANDEANTRYPFPAQASVDASIYWKRNDSASLTLGVKNLLNKTLYGDTAYVDLPSVLRHALQPGRTVLLTSTFKF